MVCNCKEIKQGWFLSATSPFWSKNVLFVHFEHRNYAVNIFCLADSMRLSQEKDGFYWGGRYLPWGIIPFLYNCNYPGQQFISWLSDDMISTVPTELV